MLRRVGPLRNIAPNPHRALELYSVDPDFDVFTEKELELLRMVLGEFLTDSALERLAVVNKHPTDRNGYYQTRSQHCLVTMRQILSQGKMCVRAYRTNDKQLRGLRRQFTKRS